MALSSVPSSLSPFDFLPPMCCSISWWLSQFCRLLDLWPLHFIEKGSKLIGKVHNLGSQPENRRTSGHKRHVLRGSKLTTCFTSLRYHLNQPNVKNYATPTDHLRLSFTLCQGKLCETTRKIFLNMIYWRCLLFSGTFLCDNENNSSSHAELPFSLVTNKLRAIHHHFRWDCDFFTLSSILIQFC
jgi:hypothetical protein